MVTRKTSRQLKGLKETRALIRQDLQILEEALETIKALGARIQRIERARGAPLRDPWSEEELHSKQNADGFLLGNILEVRNTIWKAHYRLVWTKEHGLQLIENRLAQLEKKLSPKSSRKSGAP